MQESLLDGAVELLGLLVYTGGGLIAAALGVRAEYIGIQDVLAGQSLLGAWFVFVGLVALAVAATLVRDKVTPKLRERLGEPTN